MTPDDRPRAAEEPAAPLVPGEAPPVHNQADQFSKSLLRDALSCASIATPGTEVEVVAATQRIDVYAVPDPARAEERHRMGLLGELAAEPALFEPFRNTPNLPPIRRVLCKQLTWHHELERRAAAAARAAARAAGRGPGGSGAEETGDGARTLVPFPCLVVISPGCPDTVLESYGFQAGRPGVYEAVPGLRMRLIVLAELPRTRETLLLRLLGAGRLLAAALEDMEALPGDAWERSVATPLLVHFGRATRGKPVTNEEDDVSAEIRAWFEDYQQQVRDEGLRAGRDEGLRAGRDEGLRAGRAEEAARAVLMVLRARGILVPDGARERILAQKDLERLEQWLEKAAVAESVADVIRAPS